MQPKSSLCPLLFVYCKFFFVCALLLSVKSQFSDQYLFGLGVSARRIVAVGDLHGDYNQSLSVLRLAGLLDVHNNWSGGDTYLVQTGDILDVGPDDLRIVRLLMQLGTEARKVGGDVHQLIGNHELRNLRGDFSKVDSGSLHETGGESGRAELLSNRTKLGMYLRTRKAIFHYGPFLFMHGGFSTATAALLTSLDKVEQFNDALRTALVTGSPSSYLAESGLDLNEDDPEAVTNPILVRTIMTVKCKQLIKVLDKHFQGIQSVVVGHVPHDFEDWHLCGGRLIDIDFRMSRWKRGDPGHVAALEIDDRNWHYRLHEGTLRYFDPIPKHQEEKKRINFLRLSLFIAALIVGVLGILHLFRLREARIADRLAAEEAGVSVAERQKRDYGAFL